MKNLAIFSTLFIALLVLASCENRNSTPDRNAQQHHPDRPPVNRNAPHNPNQEDQR